MSTLSTASEEKENVDKKPDKKKNKKDKKADPDRFRGEGVNFRAKLIGIESVDEPRGDRMCQEAMTKVKMAAKASNTHKQKILVNVSLEGLKLLDEKSAVILHHHAVHKISFISRDVSDPRAFGYVYGTSDGSHEFYGIKTDKPAEGLVLSLRDLFQVVFEMKKKEVEQQKQKKDVDDSPQTPSSTATENEKTAPIAEEEDTSSNEAKRLKSSVEGLDQMNTMMDDQSCASGWAQPWNSPANSASPTPSATPSAAPSAAPSATQSLHSTTQFPVSFSSPTAPSPAHSQSDPFAPHVQPLGPPPQMYGVPAAVQPRFPPQYGAGFPGQPAAYRSPLQQRAAPPAGAPDPFGADPFYIPPTGTVSAGDQATVSFQSSPRPAVKSQQNGLQGVPGAGAGAGASPAADPFSGLDSIGGSKPFVDKKDFFRTESPTLAQLGSSREDLTAAAPAPPAAAQGAGVDAAAFRPRPHATAASAPPSAVSDPATEAFPALGPDDPFNTSFSSTSSSISRKPQPFESPHRDKLACMGLQFHLPSDASDDISIDSPRFLRRRGSDGVSSAAGPSPSPAMRPRGLMQRAKTIDVPSEYFDDEDDEEGPDPPPRTSSCSHAPSDADAPPSMPPRPDESVLRPSSRTSSISSAPPGSPRLFNGRRDNNGQSPISIPRPRPKGRPRTPASSGSPASSVGLGALPESSSPRFMRDSAVRSSDKADLQMASRRISAGARPLVRNSSEPHMAPQETSEFVADFSEMERKDSDSVSSVSLRRMDGSDAALSDRSSEFSTSVGNQSLANSFKDSTSVGNQSLANSFKDSFKVDPFIMTPTDPFACTPSSDVFNTDFSDNSNLFKTKAVTCEKEADSDATPDVFGNTDPFADDPFFNPPPSASSPPLSAPPVPFGEDVFAAAPAVPPRPSTAEPPSLPPTLSLASSADLVVGKSPSNPTRRWESFDVFEDHSPVRPTLSNGLSPRLTRAGTIASDTIITSRHEDIFSPHAARTDIFPPHAGRTSAPPLSAFPAPAQNNDAVFDARFEFDPFASAPAPVNPPVAPAPANPPAPSNHPAAPSAGNPPDTPPPAPPARSIEQMRMRMRGYTVDLPPPRARPCPGLSTSPPSMPPPSVSPPPPPPPQSEPPPLPTMAPPPVTPRSISPPRIPPNSQPATTTSKSAVVPPSIPLRKDIGKSDTANVNYSDNVQKKSLDDKVIFDRQPTASDIGNAAPSDNSSDNISPTSSGRFRQSECASFFEMDAAINAATELLKNKMLGNMPSLGQSFDVFEARFESPSPSQHLPAAKTDSPSSISSSPQPSTADNSSKVPSGESSPRVIHASNSPRLISLPGSPQLSVHHSSPRPDSAHGSPKMDSAFSSPKLPHRDVSPKLSVIDNTRKSFRNDSPDLTRKSNSPLAMGRVAELKNATLPLKSQTFSLADSGMSPMVSPQGPDPFDTNIAARVLSGSPASSATPPAIPPKSTNLNLQTSPDSRFLPNGPDPFSTDFAAPFLKPKLDPSPTAPTAAPALPPRSNVAVPPRSNPIAVPPRSNVTASSTSQPASSPAKPAASVASSHSSASRNTTSKYIYGETSRVHYTSPGSSFNYGSASDHGPRITSYGEAYQQAQARQNASDYSAYYSQAYANQAASTAQQDLYAHLPAAQEQYSRPASVSSHHSPDVYKQGTEFRYPADSLQRQYTAPGAADVARQYSHQDVLGHSVHLRTRSSDSTHSSGSPGPYHHAHMRQLSNDGSSTGIPSPNPARHDVFQYPTQPAAHSPAPHYAATAAYPATSQAAVQQAAYQNQTPAALQQAAANYPSQVDASQATAAYQYAQYQQAAAYSQQYGQDVYGSSPSQYPHAQSHPSQSIYDFPPGAPSAQTNRMYPQVYQQHAQNIYGSPDLYRRQSASAYAAPPGSSAYAAQPQYDYLPPGGYGATTNGMDAKSATTNPVFNPFGTKDRQHTESPFQNSPWPPAGSSDC